MHFDEHVVECIVTLGDGVREREIYKTVNTLIDQFAHFPDMDCLRQHRQFLHHAAGIAYFRRRFGPLGEQAARLHVLSDCGWIPAMADYHNGVANEMGVRLTREETG